jgi:membrane protein implicated in regulation of membrane protease activity
MFSWFTELSLVEKIFAFCAAIGGLLFLIRLGMLLLGLGDHDSDVDVHPDIDGSLGDHVDAGVEASGEADASDFGFKILTFQGLTAFFMMFGLVGLAVMRGGVGGWRMTWALAGGIFAGLLAVWLISWVFVFFKRMQHSGTMDLRNAIGQTGKVYLTIPQGGIGKVQVEFQGRLSVLDAVSEGGVEIRSDQAVKVANVNGGTLVVRKVE